MQTRANHLKKVMLLAVVNLWILGWESLVMEGRKYFVRGPKQCFLKFIFHCGLHHFGKIEFPKLSLAVNCPN